MTAPPEELMLRVFDGLVLFSKQAIERMTTAPSDIQGRHELLRRAQRACAIAMGSIDMDAAGELGRSNFLLYEFWHHELVLANIEGNVSRVEALLPEFQKWRDTWYQAVKLYRADIAVTAGPRVDVAAV